MSQPPKALGLRDMQDVVTCFIIRVIIDPFSLILQWGMMTSELVNCYCIAYIIFKCIEDFMYMLKSSV